MGEAGVSESGNAADGGAATVVGGDATDSSVGAGDDGRDGDGCEGDAVVGGGATVSRVGARDDGRDGDGGEDDVGEDGCREGGGRQGRGES